MTCKKQEQDTGTRASRERPLRPEELSIQALQSGAPPKPGPTGPMCSFEIWVVEAGTTN